PAGTLLVLDDLQWAGPDALDLLAALVRGAPASLRVVGAYRDTEVRPADPLGLMLADLARAGLARHHALRPLAAEEAAALLDALLVGVAEGDRALATGALERAGGVPLFLVSYAQAVRVGAQEAVPWDLAQGVRQRVALLPPAAQHLLGVAAIAGRNARRTVLMAVAGQSEETVLAGLEAACRARLLREEGDDAYPFAHAVIREVVEADVGAARRAVLHRRMAEALERTPAGASPEVLAHHYLRGGDEAKAVQYLELAGDRAWAQRAHDAAERHYRAVVERLETLGRAPEAVRVREKLGEVLYRAGRYEAAIQVLEPAAEALRAAGDWQSLGRVTARLGGPHAMAGTPREGIARLTALLENLEQSGTSASTQATLYEALGGLLFVAGEYGASLATSARAAALARTAGDDCTRVRAEWNRVNILQMLGRLEDALRLGQEALPLVEAVGDRDNLLRAHRDLAYLHTLRGAVETGRRSIERALAVAEQMGDPGELSFTLALRGWLAVLRGAWPSACADLDRAVTLSRQVDRSALSAYPLLFRARLSLAAGDRAAATAAVQEAIDLAEWSGDLQALRWASGVMTELDVLEGRPEAANARLGPLLDREGLEECDVTALLPVLAWAQLEQGQVEQAASVVEQALARARAEDMQLVLVEALLVQAMIAIRQKRWAQAQRSLEEGVALARRMPHPYAEARLLHVDGQRHAATGEPEPARERLAAALAIFRRLGACQDVEQTEQALTVLRGGPPREASPQMMAALPIRHRAEAAAPAGQRLSRRDRQAWTLERLHAEGPLSPGAYARALGVSVDTALL
ncbi:MAG TPA: hypothetical protein VKF37_13730, partial [Chloroflexota bacterium]|nr:hypothetical protein [Chloroflexota bacterium]